MDIVLNVFGGRLAINGKFQSGDSVIVILKATVTQVPSPSLISNTANVTYTYRINPSGPDIVNAVTSNAVPTQINLGQLTVTKAVDKNYATINDVLTYSFEVKNTGNVNTTNSFFLDVLQPDVTFNSGSVTVNGVSQSSYNPAAGFDLGTMTPGQIITVVYKVQVVS